MWNSVLNETKYEVGYLKKLFKKFTIFEYLAKIMT